MKDDLEIYALEPHADDARVPRLRGERARSAPARPFFLMTGFRKPHAPWEAPGAHVGPVRRRRDRDGGVRHARPRHAADRVVEPAQRAARERLELRVRAVQRRARGRAARPAPRVLRGRELRRRARRRDPPRLDEHGLAGRRPSSSTPTGYHLGEHGEWEKKSNFDLVVRVPLIVRVPWKRARSARPRPLSSSSSTSCRRSRASSSCPAPVVVDGADASVVFDDPTAAAEKDAAYHQYPACGVTAWNATRARRATRYPGSSSTSCRTRFAPTRGATRSGCRGTTRRSRPRGMTTASTSCTRTPATTRPTSTAGRTRTSRSTRRTLTSPRAPPRDGPHQAPHCAASA